MLAPGGNFAIAQFRKIYDNPDVNLLMADIWEHWENSFLPKAPGFAEMTQKIEEILIKVYAILYWEDFHFDHVYPTRSSSIDGPLYAKREELMMT